MERYIKALYIASIIVIVAFLGMQAYWLYSRFEYSVREYENDLLPRTSEILEQYNLWRDHTAAESGSTYKYVSTYNIDMDKKTDDEGNRARTIKVKAMKYEPWRVLGYPSPRDLTKEEYAKSATIALQKNSDVDSIVVSSDANAAPSEGALWAAGSAISLDFNHPFSKNDFDSLLRNNRIDAEVTLVKTDSVIWEPILKRHKSLTNPQVSVVLPYSILEKKCVAVSCEIPVWNILGKMLWTLIIAALISLLLTGCLIWQFKIIVRLNRIDKMRNSFITTMIHELKRPVSTLKMCVSGLRNKKMAEDAGIREELLADTKDALDLLSSYFSKLRDITFNDCTQIPLSCGTIDLHQVVEMTAKRIPVPSGKSVDFKIDIDREIVLYADTSHISNIFFNLFENAIKYSGDSVTIAVGSQTEEDGSITITVQDNGNGISQSDIRKVFTRFYRGESSGSDIPGMGLGLAYVKLLIEAHGGRISVSSHTIGFEKGTCFTINLPQ